MAQRWLAALLRAVVGPHARAIVVATPDGLFAIDPEDQGVGRQLRLHGAWQPDERRRLAALLRPSDRLLVVGAHVGAVALPLARHCAHVVAVEANPASFDLLALNVSINSYVNVETMLLAADDRPGRLRLLQSRTNSGGAKRVPRIDDVRYRHDHPREIEVCAGRLDDALPGQRFDAIVMDIEGSEVPALRGMLRLATSCRVLVVEFLPHHLRQVAGVSVAELLDAVPAHLGWMYVPSLRRMVPRAESAALLASMMDGDRGDDGIVFSVEPFESVGEVTADDGSVTGTRVGGRASAGATP